MFYALAFPVLALYWLTLRRLAFDARSISILLAAFLLGVSCLFHIGNWVMFSTDWVAHVQYIYYLNEHHSIPPVDFNATSRHPPAYYLLALPFYKLGLWAGDRDALDYVRYLGLILFSGFWVFAALTLRHLFPKRDAIYYLCLSMMAFWPVGITKTTAIGCDLLVYPAMMGAIYFLVRWLQSGRDTRAHLSGAALSAATAVLAKNSGLVLVGITTLFFLAAVWQHRHALRSLLKWHLLASLALMLLASQLTLARDGYVAVWSPASDYGLYEWLWLYFYFDPLEFTRDTMINPFSGEPMYHFWHYYLRSLLVGDYIAWRALAVLFAYGFVWLAVIVYAIYGLWARKRLPAERGVWQFLLVVAALLTGMLLYRFHTIEQPNQIADGRYVYPIITIIIAFYGKAMEWHQSQGRQLAYRIGSGLAIGFVMLSLVLILSQDYVLSRVQ